MAYLDYFVKHYLDYTNYLINEVLHPHWGNFFYWLLSISLVIYSLELIIPWRKKQSKIRNDFWLDVFYMFFNVFIFSAVGYAAISDIFVKLFNDILFSVFKLSNIVWINLSSFPHFIQLFILFIVKDFIQWNIHILLHKVPFLWKFHKVHHSVTEMGFAAHLRYHFVENIVYRSLEYIPLAMIGFGIQDFIIIHLFTLTIGHLNHANIYLPIGFLSYIFNTPQVHIWHHAKYLPKNKSGVNFGQTLIIWDYLFGTIWLPSEGRDIPLGFEDVEEYPKNFFGQVYKPFEE